MAATSWAHICSYSASTVAIAGALKPSRLDVTNDTNCVRLANTATGCTVAATVASKAAAAIRAWLAACPACTPVDASQPR
ncbi:hypothetical protein MSS2_02151 [Mycobacterium marinum]|uniref:Uncharacterized protein n=1 Tax=Mycobacterium marinum TaxID=1781 RepID=A0A3E2MSJ5_MYCMR|nr:hypothetical protein DE4381_02732 [Mycobacterium marinum]RFZ14517.1 hypothetical protein VIMS_02668 [Mycobacterium marinum]RFZ18370.1 hypothetical protein DSM44344_05166 [Mycobacterium marinum]RFZ37795.1 hypothetical protein DAVIS_03622 [Mycobacterium marinum]RFZ42493.1 hypothetical protein KST_01481 [Mycobacterium marinum]